ncbi:MAG: hypothetical protein HKN52_01720 [Eudoraea sp.]|nr:hypothetical protein [Eudoraea sp.]
MKIAKQLPSYFNFITTVILLIVGGTLGNAQVIDKDGSDFNTSETEAPPIIYWHVKAYHPEATFMDIKAIDEEGNYHDVLVVQDSDDTSVMNVKAFVNGIRLPVKITLKGSDRYYPVKAIDENGTLIKIKAIAQNGEIMDVKGFSRSGNIINLRAITKDHKYYDIIAISPLGRVNGVKGIKMLDTEQEAVINGVPIFAHVKSLQQN